jgi:cobalamin biosynthesis Mg chelatase CobN
MMMRPRRYGIMNRAIARGVTHAIRESSKHKKYNYGEHYTMEESKNQTTLSNGEVAVVIIVCCLLIVFMSVACSVF